MSSDDDLFTCPDCGVQVEPETCRACDGTGTHARVEHFEWVLDVCPVCQGDGYLVFCDACDLKENSVLSRKRDTDV